MSKDYMHYVKKDHISEILFNSDSLGSIISSSFCNVLSGIVDEINEDPHTTACFIGNNPMFSNGPLAETIPPNILDNRNQLNSWINTRQITSIINRIEVPVIIALAGDISNQTLELFMAADIRVATIDSTFQLDISGAHIPWDSGIPNLLKLVGHSVDNDMLYTKKVLTAKQGLEVHLLTRAFSGPEFETGISLLLTEIAKGAPLSHRYIKESLTRGAGMSLTEGLRLECDLNILLQTTDDRIEGLASFFEKRLPEFYGK